MSGTIWVRPATSGDVDVIARHRAGMFADMGVLPPAAVVPLAEATRGYLREAMPAGHYLGWLAGFDDEPGRVVAGAGVVVRRVPPFPAGDRVAGGREALVLNVYAEPAFRRRGLARRLMDEVLAWARSEGVDRVVLHAAPDGRPLYEQLGFVPTNEMRLAGPTPASSKRG